MLRPYVRNIFSLEYVKHLALPSNGEANVQLQLANNPHQSQRYHQNCDKSHNLYHMLTDLSIILFHAQIISDIFHARHFAVRSTWVHSSVELLDCMDCPRLQYLCGFWLLFAQSAVVVPMDPCLFIYFLCMSVCMCGCSPTDVLLDVKHVRSPRTMHKHIHTHIIE